MKSKANTFPVKFVAGLLVFWLVGVALADEKNYMQLVGELLSAVDLPEQMNEHCKKVTPKLNDPNAQALRAWEQRNASLLVEAREEIDRAERYLNLSSTPKDPKIESIEMMRAQAQVSVSQMLSKNGADFERRFCTAFPKYLVVEDQERAAEILNLVDAIRKRPERPLQ